MHRQSTHTLFFFSISPSPGTPTHSLSHVCATYHMRAQFVTTRKPVPLAFMLTARPLPLKYSPSSPTLSTSSYNRNTQTYSIHRTSPAHVPSVSSHVSTQNDPKVKFTTIQCTFSTFYSGACWGIYLLFRPPRDSHQASSSSSPHPTVWAALLLQHLFRQSTTPVTSVHSPVHLPSLTSMKSKGHSSLSP